MCVAARPAPSFRTQNAVGSWAHSRAPWGCGGGGGAENPPGLWKHIKSEPTAQGPQDGVPSRSSKTQPCWGDRLLKKNPEKCARPCNVAQTWPRGIVEGTWHGPQGGTRPNRALKATQECAGWSRRVRAPGRGLTAGLTGTSGQQAAWWEGAG